MFDKAVKRKMKRFIKPCERQRREMNHQYKEGKARWGEGLRGTNT